MTFLAAKQGKCGYFRPEFKKIKDNTQRKTWFDGVCKDISATSGRPDECDAWLRQVGNDSVSDEEFADDGKFKTLP